MTDRPGDDLVQEALRRSQEWARRAPEERAATVGELRGEIDQAFAARNPELVDATDLVQWADRRDAAGRLPELVRRLAVMAPGIRHVTGRSGDGVALPGWDMIMVADPGDAFVPAGVSAWELSSNSRPQEKAERDLAKRSADPLGVNPATSALVIVSLRRWPGKDAWTSRHQTDGVWREVRAYDADDLEAWLQLRPAAHYAISAQLGRRPDAAEALDQWWRRWSRETEPVLPRELVVAGREAQVRELGEWISSDASVVTVQADTREEALAFIHVALPVDGGDSGVSPGERAIVVREPSGWDQVAGSDAPLLLLPLSPEVDISLAIQRGHRVLIPAGPDLRIKGSAIVLPRLGRSEARTSLIACGLPERRADELALLARRSLMALRRQIGVSPILRRPAWSVVPDGELLAPLMLLGRWSQKFDGDHQVVAGFVGRPYGEIQRGLARLAAAEDPPIRRVGQAWATSSKEDLWLLLAPLLSDSDLQAFRSVFVEVLTESDPALELDAERRHMAAILGYERRWSYDLREALADTCAFLGSREAEEVGGGTRLTGTATGLVEAVLSWADDDPSGGRWASLSAFLPLLAEAAPDRFLAHVEAGCLGDKPLMLTIFRDSGSAGLFGDSSPHTGMLWALEGISWSPDYLGRAAEVLISLAEIDPGGRLANRPAASLRNVFLVYQPHTRAELPARLRVLDALRSRHSDASWPLLRSLLPGAHDWWSPTHAPRWRDWRPDDLPMATVSDLVKTCQELVTRLSQDAGDEGHRWAELVSSLGDLPEPTRLVLLQAIEQFAFRQPPAQDQETVWGAIDEFLTKHRRFPEAPWSLAGPELAEIERVRDLLHAVPPEERSARLFSHFPDLPGIDDRHGDEYEAALAAARGQVVATAMQHGGLPAVLAIARQAEVPEFVGVTLAGDGSLPDLDELVSLLGGEGPESQAAWGYASARASSRGWDWVLSKLAEHDGEWPPAVVAAVLLSAGINDDLLRDLPSFGAEVADIYWRGLSPYRVPPDLVETVVPILVRRGRPWSAVHLLSFETTSNRSGHAPSVNTIAETLDAALFGDSEEEPRASGMSYEIGVLLDVLDTAEDERIARLEFALLGLLQHERPPRALMKQLASDPEFFVEVVCRIYRSADSETVDDPTEEDPVVGEMAYTLLRSWHAVPGLRPDGTVDETVLDTWYTESKALLTSRRRDQIADSVLGEVLSSCPEGVDGVWPCEAVRAIIERERSEDLDRGLHIGRSNNRGVTSRSPQDGGKQEREIAKTYRADASELSAGWPRTAALLRGLADSYEQEARWHDESAERWMDHE